MVPCCTTFTLGYLSDRLLIDVFTLLALNFGDCFVVDFSGCVVVNFMVDLWLIMVDFMVDFMVTYRIFMVDFFSDL